MTSGLAFDRLSCLRAFPYDRFKIYMIVRIELSSVSIKHGLRTGYKTRTRYKTRTGYKIEILGGGSLNQEPDKNAIFYTQS